MYYVFHDGSIYAYLDPAVLDARQVIKADNHGLAFNKAYRRSILGDLGFSRVGSVPGTATLIYSQPPYPGTDPGPCPPFPQPIAYWNCHAMSPGLIDQVAGNDLSVVTGGASVVPGLISNAVGITGGFARFATPGTFPALVSAGSALTNAFWVNASAISFHTIVESIGSFWNNDFFQDVGTNVIIEQTFGFARGVSPTFVDSPDTPLPPGWHMLAYVLDISGSRSGIRLDTGPTWYTSLTLTPPVMSPDGHQGQLNLNQDTGETLAACEVGVWDVALTDAQLDHLYNGGAGRTYPF